MTQALKKETIFFESVAASIVAALFMVLAAVTIITIALGITQTYHAKIPKTIKNEDLNNQVKQLQNSNKISYGPNKPYAITQYKFISPPSKVKPPLQSNPSFTEYYNFIKNNEGYNKTVYKDTVGRMSIGIGFNLNRSFAASLFKRLGINYNAVLNGRKLTDKQIMQLFEYDLRFAIVHAREFVNNFDTLPINMKLVIVDMSFNMGPSRLKEFRKLKEAIEQYDFDTAVIEMKRSNWFTQVKSRAINLINIVSDLSDTYPPIQV